LNDHANCVTGGWQILEDCRMLDVTLFRPKELRRMRLLWVQPAPATSH
jgi:hypothetical protein